MHITRWYQEIGALCLLAVAATVLVSSHAPAQQSYDFYSGDGPTGLRENVRKYHLGPGRQKMEDGAFHYAMKDADFILRRFPNDPEGLKLVMEIGLRSGERQAAMPYFETALSRYPEHGETWLIYGVYLHRLGRVNDAIDAYTKAIERNGNLADAHYNLGLALLDRGETSAANEAARRAYELGHPMPGLRQKLRRRGAWEVDDDS